MCSAYRHLSLSSLSPTMRFRSIPNSTSYTFSFTRYLLVNLANTSSRYMRCNSWTGALDIRSMSNSTNFPISPSVGRLRCPKSDSAARYFCLDCRRNLSRFEVPDILACGREKNVSSPARRSLLLLRCFRCVLLRVVLATVRTSDGEGRPAALLLLNPLLRLLPTKELLRLGVSGIGVHEENHGEGRGCHSATHFFFEGFCANERPTNSTRRFVRR